MRFSERIGKRAPKEIIQVDTMDDDLRNGLWNTVYAFFLRHLDVSYWQDTGNNEYYNLVYFTWDNFLKNPIDEIPESSAGVVSLIKEKFFSWSVLDVYDFVDFLASQKYHPFQYEIFILEADSILKRELSAYRFIDGQLSPIVSNAEVDSVEQAIQNTAKSLYKGASIHLSAALEKLSDRREPDYRNSIKESISAVESVCQAITGDPKATLGPALKKIEQKMPLHGALKEGLLKIYGYTSDSDGIRHALQDESNLSQEDALFMLVTCSAFVNYLTVKADKAGTAQS